MNTISVFKVSVALVFVLGLGACDEEEPGDESSNSDSAGDDGTPPGDPVGTCFIEEYGFCNDYWTESAEDVEMFCLTPGEWSLTESCDPEGACGTCTTDAGSFVAKTYYFDGSGSEEMSQTVCENGMGVWVDIPDVTCS